MGDEQSGHIKEVGFELYNHLLEEAVALAKAEGEGESALGSRDWTPQISIDAAALIPDSYIEDLDLRLTMYRRLAALSLASHDMDIRGAGNLLGQEQSGHVKEVGIELYQHMLEEAVATARDRTGQGRAGDAPADWTPQITIGMPVMIPEDYVQDLAARLGLYRRSAALVDREEIDAFAAELTDRFGPVPDEVQNLLDIIGIKQLCRRTNVEKVDAGPKGAVLTFHNDHFEDPAGLVTLIAQEAGTMKLRPDHRLVYRRNWTDPAARVKGIKYLMRKLDELVAA